MCGIVGYVGPRDAAPILLEGLRRLEYRGYDSAGLAVLTDAGEVFVEKKAGKLSNLTEHLNGGAPAGHPGIAHTRWATHGRPNDANAHPHRDCSGRLALIHNGIIENYLRDQAAPGGRGPSVHLGDRYRGPRAPDRGAVSRRPGRGGPRCPQRGARRVRHRRHAPRPPRSDRGRPHERAAHRRAGGWRGIPGERRARDPGAHQERRHPPGGRHRRRDPGRGHDHRHGRRPRRPPRHQDPLEHRRRGEGWLPALHPEGDLRAAARHRRGAPRPRRRGRPDHPSRARRDRGEAAPGGARLRGRLRHGALRRRGGRPPDPELGGAARERPDRLGDALLAAAHRRPHPRHQRQPVGRDGRHARAPEARLGALAR